MVIMTRKRCQIIGWISVSIRLVLQVRDKNRKKLESLIVKGPTRKSMQKPFYIALMSQYIFAGRVCTT